MGLGFGDQVEAASLKVNKKIEAEWRGIEYKETEVNELEKRASSKSWKKGNRSERKEVNEDEIIRKHFMESIQKEKDKITIIDMRFEETRILKNLDDINEAPATALPMKTKLGQELLYNINIICEQQEIEVFTLIILPDTTTTTSTTTKIIIIITIDQPPQPFPSKGTDQHRQSIFRVI